MMISLQKQKYGFTLIEILVTITIIASVSVLIAQVFFTTTRVNTKTELLKDVKQNGQYALDVMSRMIRSAAGVTSECLAAGVPSKTITIKNANGDSTTFGCFYDSGNSVARIASVSAFTAQSQNLTSQNVTLGGASCADDAMTLRFTCTSSSDEPSKVAISFSLSQKGTPTDQFEKSSIQYQTIVSPRN